MEVAYKVTIKGRVTGVGFRYSALDKAGQFKTIKGYIRNADYGEVEAWIQGDKKEVGMMLEWLKTGSCMAKVDSFSFVEEKHDSSMTEFEII
ncbi:MAG: acylphosphatase [Victivallales bacterium]